MVWYVIFIWVYNVFMLMLFTLYVWHWTIDRKVWLIGLSFLHWFCRYISVYIFGGVCPLCCGIYMSVYCHIRCIPIFCLFYIPDFFVCFISLQFHIVWEILCFFMDKFIKTKRLTRQVLKFSRDKFSNCQLQSHCETNNELNK